ncbi:MAG: 1-(5-phosphoribosyl)-5-((5-phosphoribosylamino)methylideneamino)imidazole-4-carboxamide isomerase, partial [Clostridia bacterium]|nr:1-(5-phosphoribosyl)-5-((5-phosphoribosylamino)methylideneamino)imidazole-4-carboxamide isomerase [Clostridia bacterium]
KSAVAAYGKRIAVGVDLKDGYVAVKGWTEKSQYSAFAFCEKLQAIGVKTLIVTDISKDGAMQGANHALYKDLAGRFPMDIIASGGVSSLEDIRQLAALGLYGAIVGKAYYTKAFTIKEALEAAV